MMAYIDDIVIAIETVEDHMVRLREVFECLREAGFKMRVAKCDFMKSEIKYLGRVVSAEGVKPDPKTVTKVRVWAFPRTKTEMQSFWDLLTTIANLSHGMPSWSLPHMLCAPYQLSGDFGILHQWQGPPGQRRLRPIVYGSKKLTTTQAKYGAPKLEMYAAYHFIVENHSYLCPRKFTSG